jgi:ParB-like chromosome segregation protein Spo0J
MKTREILITELIPAEYNPRYLSEDGFDQLSASLKRFGVVDPAIININPERKNIRV